MENIMRPAKDWAPLHHRTEPIPTKQTSRTE